METNKYLEGIEELVEFYGFPASASSVVLSNDYSFAYHISEKLNEITDTTTPTYNQLEECRDFVRFLTLCKGSEITLTGKITTSVFGDIKNTEKKITLNNWHLLQTLQAIAMLEGEKIERFIDKHGIQKEEPLIKNKLMGKYAIYLLWYIDSYDLGDISKTKKYSFIYDALLLTGIIEKITGKETINDEGFSGNIGNAKLQEVRKWLKAYKGAAKDDIFFRITPSQFTEVCK